MKIAVVSNNGKRVSRHYGMARQFVVLTVENGEVIARDMRPKRPGQGSHAQEGHEPGAGTERGHGRRAAQLVADCQVVITGGMGAPAMTNLERVGLEVVATDERSVDEAALRYARGDLPHVDDLVHDGGEDGSSPVRFEGKGRDRGAQSPHVGTAGRDDSAAAPPT